MAKSYNQKVKILYLQKMLHETGEDRVITMQEILARLLEYGIHAERKSIYDDIESLRSFGMDVKFKRGRPGGYYVAGQMAQGKNEHQDMPVLQEVLSHKENSAAEQEGRTLEPAESEEKAARESEKKAAPEPEAEKKAAPGQNFKFAKEADPGSGRQMKLLCRDKTKKAVQSYFGKAAQYKDKELGYFTVTAIVTENPLFYGWLTSMGRDVHILKPKKAALNYREYLKTLAKEYKGI